MPPPLAELTAQAQTLTSAGDLVGARAVLDDVLRTVDADPRRATADLAVAAALHARILIALGDPESARLWAAFAHSAEERLHGRQDERTIAAAATHAAVLHLIGQHGRAALVYHDLVGELARMDGPDAPRVLAAEADLAIAEHAAGHCGTARARLARAWRHHRDVYGDTVPAGIKMLARLGAMERECGLDEESREHLALAGELSSRFLPPDHPLARQTAALAAGKPTGRHSCGRREPSGDTPFRPFPRRPTVPDPESDRPGYPPAAPGRPTNPNRTGQVAASDNPAPDDRPTNPRTGHAAAPDNPAPDDRPTDPNGTVYQQPLYLSDVHRLPGDLTGRHARADTPPPLPDHPQPRRGLPPLLLAGLLAGGVAAAAAVVILTLPDADGATEAVAPPSVAPPATPLATTGDPGAPANLRIRDDGGSVTLQWAYPRGAEGVVLISGGRAGQVPQKFQELPAGADEFIVYSLDKKLNYCFTVAVQDTAGRVADSAPICTDR